MTAKKLLAAGGVALLLVLSCIMRLLAGDV